MLSHDVKTLERLFDKLNERFYDGVLPRPVITIQSKGKLNAYGWFSVGKVWVDKETNTKMHEINVSAEYITRPIEEVVGTLLHEMVHLHCSYHGIKDTSNRGIYHNARFKQEAEEHGLVITKGQYGWHVTELNDETRKFLKEIHAKDFTLFRYGHGSSENNSNGDGVNATPRKKSSIKWVCPCCGSIARTTKKANLVCGDCYVRMVEAV